MKKRAFLLSAVLASAASSAGVAAQDSAAPGTSLFVTVSRLDAGLFGSLNHCSSAKELQKHARFLAPNLEFYHDRGGVSWSRSAYLSKTKKNVCGVFYRELIPGTLEVFAVKNFGAIEQGKHQFCYIKSGECFGRARFLILWHRLPGRWEATRVLSYGHLSMGSRPPGRSSER